MDATLILVVEDEPLILLDVEAALTDAGFEVLTAPDARTAMALLDQKSADIRAVLTDIRLGKGPNGWDVGRYARVGVPAIPVVYMSGDSSGDWMVQGVPHSIMIAKPFAFAQVVTAISTLLNQADSAPA
jgi:DNA-binding response OmpR family regulator